MEGVLADVDAEIKPAGRAKISGVKHFAELARRHAHVLRKDGCEVTVSKSDGIGNLTDG